VSPERDRRSEILDAAFERFSRYGFRNTSMDDIARAAGVSRPLIYQYFDNKETVFRDLAARLHDEARTAAERALREAAGSLADQIAAALIAKLRIPVEVIGASEHHDELLDTSSRIAGDIAAAAGERYQAVLATRLRAAKRSGELAPDAAVMTTPDLLRLLTDAAFGIAKGALADPAGPGPWQARVRTLVGLLLSPTTSPTTTKGRIP
jgi:AcrR family transcriptional regulator